MTYDFLEDAAECLKKQPYPFAILCGAPNTSLTLWDCQEDNELILASELRKFADLIEKKHNERE